MRSSGEQVTAEWTLDELAIAAGALARGDAAATVRRIATLKDATADSVAVFCDERYRGEFKATGAGVVVLNESDAQEFSGNCLISSNPRAAFARVSDCLNPPEPFTPGIHPKAIVSDRASVAGTAAVCAGAVVDEDAQIGSHAVIGVGAHIGRGAAIGDSTRIESNVVVYRECIIGRSCVISANSVIGSSGFSYAGENGRWVKMRNIGNVVIGDEVDIGAATTIDRSTMQSTEIGDRVKIDNNVQIAHNVSIGEDTIIAGNVGIAGSVRIGCRCMLAGQVGILDHLEVCDDVVVLAGSMVTKSISVPGRYSATVPARPAKNWRKILVRLRQLGD